MQSSLEVNLEDHLYSNSVVSGRVQSYWVLLLFPAVTLIFDSWQFTRVLHVVYEWITPGFGPWHGAARLWRPWGGFLSRLGGRR